jgi:hypothetical protein
MMVSRAIAWKLETSVSNERKVVARAVRLFVAEL